MKSGQPLMRDLQFDAPRRIGLDEIDEVPGNIAGRNPEEQGPKNSGGDHALWGTAHPAPPAPIYSLKLQERVLLRDVAIKIHLVHAFNPASAHLNHPPV